MSKRLSKERKKELLEVYKKITPPSHIRMWMKKQMELGQTIGHIELTYSRTITEKYALDHDLYVKYIRHILPGVDVMKTTYEHIQADRVVKESVLRLDWSKL